MDQVLKKFLNKVKKTKTCWLWVSKRGTDSYGTFSFDGQSRPAHRVSYEIFKGKIPDGLHIDHLCSVRSCVNPEHLEAVTCTENVRRGFSLMREKKIKNLKKNKKENASKASDLILLRHRLCLTQEKFSKECLLKANTIAKLECNLKTVTDRLISYLKMKFPKQTKDLFL